MIVASKEEESTDKVIEAIERVTDEQRSLIDELRLLLVTEREEQREC